MATKSFLKDIVIKDKKSAKAFLSALENAEGKRRKQVDYNTKVINIKDQEAIKNMFKRKNSGI